MYIILWKNVDLDTSHWTAYHPVWYNLDDAQEWLEEYKKEYGKHYDYKLCKISFLD